MTRDKGGPDQVDEAHEDEQGGEKESKFRQPETNLRRAVDLIVAVKVITHSTRAFLSKWKVIRAKLDQLHSDLSNALLLLDFASTSTDGDVHDDLSTAALLDILVTLSDCDSLARSCTELSYSGKLLMQSDLDVISTRLDEHLRQIDGIYGAGVLAPDTLAIVVCRPSAGASREDFCFFVRDLFTRVQIGTRAMKTDALRTVEEIVREDDKYRSIVVETGDLAQLVGFLESDDPEISEVCAKILSSVARDEEQKGVLLSAGVVFPAIGMLESGRIQGREAAAALLNRLTSKSDNAWSVSSQGGVSASLTICRTEEGGTGRNCAGILRNLAGVEEIRQFMVEEGVVSVMLWLLRSSDEGTQAYAADCLRILSSKDAFVRNSIVKENGILLLVSALRSKSTECRQFALQAIRNFTPLLDFTKIVLSSGFLTQTPEMLRRGDFEMQVAALRGVRDLLKLSDEAKKVAGDDAEMLPALINLLELKSAVVRGLAGEALAEFLSVPRNRNRLIQEDHYIVSILQTLEKDDSIRVRHFLLLALLWISSSSSGRRKISSSSSFHALERLAKNDVPEARRIVRRISGNTFRKILDGIWKS